MKNKHINEYLKYYINAPHVNFAVLLKGKWGSGKTFFIKKLIDEWKISRSEEDEFISLDPIYVSLNGLNSKKEIIIKLKEKINPFLHSKGVKIASSILKSFIKSTLKIDFDFDNDDSPDGNLNFNIDPIAIFKEDNEQIKGNRIIIFDDIERCKIPMDELFGFINDFVEHSNCKIILLSDEDKIIEKDKEQENILSYKSFREKIIGQTFEIEPDIDDAVDYFINSVKSDVKKNLQENRNLIIEIFNASEKKNLRVLGRALHDFERLTNLLNPQLNAKMDEYNLLVKSLLAYFLIFVLENNTGSTDIHNFQQFFIIDETQNKFIHYEEAIKSYNLVHSTKIFDANNLLLYIKDGKYEEIVNELNNCSIFNPQVEEDWEKLWYWKFMDDEDFSQILEKVENEFFTTEKFHFTEVLHIFGIFMSLIENHLYDRKIKDEIIDRAELLISTSKDLIAVKDLNLLLRTTNRKSYAAEHMDEFKSLLIFVRNTVKKEQQIETFKLIEEKMNNLDNNNVDELYDFFKIYQYSNNCILENTSIFKDLDTGKLSEIIFNLNNKGIRDLLDYFIYRYYPEQRYSNLSIEDYHKEELDFINNLERDLTQKIVELEDKPLKKRSLNTFVEKLTKISIKLSPTASKN